MRLAVLAVAVCVVLSGCATPFATPGGGDTGGTDVDDGTGSDGAQSEESRSTVVVHEERADPGTDRLGWENGYWHDDPVAVNATDGLNESEREAVIARAMARVEIVRNLEFEQSVNVTVESRSNFSERFGGGETNETLRQFDNAKFEALFLIGNDENSIDTQSANRNQTVAGFYSPGREAIVIVSDSRSPQLDGERTLAHELVHALQDQQFNLSLSETPRTRDAYNARNGLVEGDARAVEREYFDRCGEDWSCLPSASGGDGGDGGQPSIHLGVYVLSFFPYSDGPGLVAHLRDGDDWSAVNDAFGNPPTSSAEVTFPAKYGSFERTDVELRDRASDGWERVRPPDRPDYGVLGPSALTAMFGYTLYDEYNRSSAVEPGEFLNTDAGSVNTSDPFNYGLAPLQGWQGDRLHVYERGAETGYVWRLVWASPEEARLFADRYRAVLAHWGGDEVRDGVWVIEGDSPFAGAVAVEVEGGTVTVVGAPDREALGDVHRGAG
jgi:hypothetical protein